MQVLYHLLLKTMQSLLHTGSTAHRVPATAALCYHCTFGLFLFKMWAVLGSAQCARALEQTGAAILLQLSLWLQRRDEKSFYLLSLDITPSKKEMWDVLQLLLGIQTFSMRSPEAEHVCCECLVFLTPYWIQTVVISHQPLGTGKLPQEQFLLRQLVGSAGCRRRLSRLLPAPPTPGQAPLTLLLTHTALNRWLPSRNPWE